ncbi:MAG: PaaX family transcriptional regulator C-terminal domain-containing protein [Roseobacter sp.]
MPPDAYRTVCERLLALGGHRVWSLLVTVFGDLAGKENAVLAGPVLSDLMTRLGVRPAATRVALHRLRKDGWITSTKHGRQSLHGLTDYGLRETQNAGRRVYAPPGTTPDRWQVVVTDPACPDPGTDMQQRGFLSFGPRFYVGFDQTPPPDGALRLEGTTPPEWLRIRLAEVLRQDDYDALHAILIFAEAALTDPQAFDPLDQAVLRCLIVHNWRRLLLKHPDMPPVLFPPNWRGEDCRGLVHLLLARFPLPDVSQH